MNYNRHLVLLLISSILYAGPELQFEKTPNGGLQPQVIVDKAGTIHLLYYKGKAREGDIFYVTRAKGKSAFSSPLKVNSIANSACCIGSIYRARMAIGKNGIVHVIWNGSFGYVKKQWEKKGKKRSPEEFTFLFYSRLSANKKSFTKQVNLNHESHGLDGNGSIIVDNKGMVSVFWHADIKGKSGRRVFQVRSTNGGKSFSKEIALDVEQLGVCECCTLEAFTSAKAISYIMYRTANKKNRDAIIYSFDGSRKPVKYTRLNRHAWAITHCPASSFSFAEDSKAVHAAWETEDSVYTKNLMSKSKAVKVSIKSKRAKYPSLAINKKGERLLSWSAEPNWGVGGFIQYRITDKNNKVLAQSYNKGHSPVGYSFSAACALPSGKFIIFY